NLGGQSNVQLRIAFAADAAANTQNDGFAFDDFQVYDTPAIEGGVTAIVAPNSDCGLSSQELVTITVKNYGSKDLVNIPVSYKIGSSTVSEVMPGPISINASANYTFITKANLSAVGTYSI